MRAGVESDPDIREESLPVFVRAIRDYFSNVAGEPAQTETPYLLTGAPEVYDFTAVIGVSGDLQGAVYFTAPIGLIDAILHSVGESHPSDELRCDMAGEITNTLSGNVRKGLGPGFMISVPVVIQGKPKRLMLPKDTACFVIPIRWRHLRSLLMLCLSENSASGTDYL